jgi:SAM-dependent methyltransferase
MNLQNYSAVRFGGSLLSYPVNQPSGLERILFDAGLIQKVSLAEIYDIKAGTTIQQAWLDLNYHNRPRHATDPDNWHDKLYGCTRGEFFVNALAGCSRILDVGCGEGWPSLYLARAHLQVVGIDVSGKHLETAQAVAALMGLDNVQFIEANLLSLPFPDSSFDGVCYGGNVLTYDFNPQIILNELYRVLRPGGVFALEQWPVDRATPAYERIGFFIDGGPPILHYQAGLGLYSRSYFIYLNPKMHLGQLVVKAADSSRMLTNYEKYLGALTPIQRQACEKAKTEIEAGNLSLVMKAIYSGEDRSLAADELPSLLSAAGFTGFASWAIPNEVRFAQQLKRANLLHQIDDDHIHPFLQALVAAAPRHPKWDFQWVTCKKP